MMPLPIRLSTISSASLPSLSSPSMPSSSLSSSSGAVFANVGRREFARTGVARSHAIQQRTLQLQRLLQEHHAVDTPPLVLPLERRVAADVASRSRTEGISLMFNYNYSGFLMKFKHRESSK